MPPEGASAGANAADGDTSLGNAFDRLERLLTFPVDFPLKIMGRRHEHFAQAISEVARRHVPAFDPATIELRGSSGGKWLSVTLVVRVDSRRQLEALYRELATHPMVRLVL